MLGSDDVPPVRSYSLLVLVNTTPAGDFPCKPAILPKPPGPARCSGVATAVALEPEMVPEVQLKNLRLQPGGSPSSGGRRRRRTPALQEEA